MNDSDRVLKSEKEAISSDEWVVRCIWLTRFRQTVPITISPGAFEPRNDEVSGISVFRLACVTDPSEILSVFAEEKRPKYGLVKILVSDLNRLGLSVISDLRSPIPGHALIPELTIQSHNSDKTKWRMAEQNLADLAIQNVLLWPVEVMQN